MLKILNFISISLTEIYFILFKIFAPLQCKIYLTSTTIQTISQGHPQQHSQLQRALYTLHARYSFIQTLLHSLLNFFSAQINKLLKHYISVRIFFFFFTFINLKSCIEETTSAWDPEFHFNFDIFCISLCTLYIRLHATSFLTAQLVDKPLKHQL